MNEDSTENRAVEARLRDERPTLTPHELDAAKQRAMAGSSGRRGGLLRSRAAFTAVLATGILMSSTGATMAVTGIAGDGSASVSQYTPPGSTTPTDTTTAPAQTQTPSSTPPTIGPSTTTPTGNGGGNEGTGDGGGNEGTSDNGSDDDAGDDDGDVQDQQQSGDDGNGGGDDTSPASQVRSTAQTAAADGGDQLPFTGIAVFPLLFGGLALVAVGAVMRRRVPHPGA